MALAVEPGPDEVSRIRKERVHNTMLIEVLVLMVFLAMAFAFVTKDESKTSLLQAQIDELRADLKETKKQLREAQAENAELRRINRELSTSLARWMEHPPGSIRANDDFIMVPSGEFKGKSDENTNLKALVDELQRDNARLRALLNTAKGGGGTDRPNCKVTPGFLLTIELMGDGGFQTRGAWQPEAASFVRDVPGAVALGSGQVMREAEFNRLAGQINGWALQQTVPCGFRVKVRNRHSSLNLYLHQLSVVERHFYVRRE